MPNASSILRFDCRGAVAHQLRKEWRITALANIVIFTMIVRDSEMDIQTRIYFGRYLNKRLTIGSSILQIILYAIAYYARNKIM